MKVLILGLGNPILSDDGVGIKIAEELGEKIKNVDVVKASIAGLNILELISGYDRLILIDSIKTQKGKPGVVYKMKLEDLSTNLHLTSSHGIDFATVIEMGKNLGYKLPEIIDIYAVEVKDNTTFSEECTQQVKQSIPKIVEKIKKEVQKLL